jgi:D-alanyl-D-alanine endopeptidase (penicillin-binding protein 7)
MRLLLLLGCLATTLFSTNLTADESRLQVAALSANTRPIAPAAANVWQQLNPKKLKLRSASALVVDRFGNEVYAKSEDTPRPIASITKLMTAMVILDARLSMKEKITITKADRDTHKLTGSRLKYGAKLTREQMISLALMSSENRAAASLGRTYPGGKKAFVKAMNKKARALGMNSSRFKDPAGLNAGNIASARDLVTMVRAAQRYPMIRKATTTRSMTVYPWKGRGPLRYANTNRLLKNKNWSIELSKTGYIHEAGRCLTMQAEIVDQPLIIVLLNSFGKLTPMGDSNRIRKWIERDIHS